MARILLADDDAATRDLVQRALALDGHEVIVTQDGAEQLKGKVSRMIAKPFTLDEMRSTVRGALA
jgi:DNA-binding NtrC family response regulator